MRELLKRLRSLTCRECPGCREWRTSYAKLSDKYEITRRAQSVQSRRLARFQAEHPELWRRYFARPRDGAE